MKKATGKFMAGLLISLLVCTGVMSVSAQEIIPPANLEGSEVSPFYTYITNTSVSLSIPSGTANMTSKVTGVYSTTTKVAISMTLQKKSTTGTWGYVSDWSDVYNSYMGTLSKSMSVSKGTYRVKTVFTAYSGSSSETVTQYSAEVTY